ncbi:hypothetical protein GCM10027168_13610 [Streptomyces capparidis]
MDADTLARQLRALAERTEITELLDRFERSLDERRYDEDWARAFLTEDVLARLPGGTFRGRDALRGHLREVMALFDRTMHVNTNAVVETDGDRATARGSQISTHVLADGSEGVFISAGRTEIELARTAEGWRISAVSLHQVWTQGTPPQPTEAQVPVFAR